MSLKSSSGNKRLTEDARFEFGANWLKFLDDLNDERIKQAELSLKEMLQESLDGRSFVDIGSGSGLSSLAACRLGAVVHSFDFDSKSVACTKELKRRYRPDDAAWTIERGSVLDKGYLCDLGQFDVVYSWGVLHHTGAMWQAMENVIPLVKSGGKLFIAIYNDQGIRSRYWYQIKKLYVQRKSLRLPLLLIHMPYPFLPSFLMRLASGRLRLRRGMSFWRDVVDWIGGYPFEVASVNEIVEFFRGRGFRLDRLVRTTRSGCNEYVFVNEAPV